MKRPSRPKCVLAGAVQRSGRLFRSVSAGRRAALAASLAALILVPAPLAAETETDACSGGDCYTAGASDNTWCHTTGTAAVQVPNNDITTGYDGKVTLDFHYKAVEDLCPQNDASFTFNLWVNGNAVATVPCAGSCDNSFSTGGFFCQKDTTHVTLTLEAKVNGSGSTSTQGNFKVTLRRPPCPSTTTVGTAGTYYQNSAGAVINGTVTDNGCGAQVNADQAVKITVTDPDNNASETTVAVANGAFTWTYTFPSPKVGHYGTYTVTADYLGKNNDHPLQTSSGSDNFVLKEEVGVGGPPWGADWAGSVPFAPGNHFLVALQAQKQVVAYPVEGLAPSGVVDLSRSIPGWAEGVAAVTAFGNAKTYPLLAISQAGVDSLVLIDLYGNRVLGYPVAVSHPWGLAYDGADLWVASNVTNGPICLLAPETGKLLRSIYPSIGNVTDLAWDPGTQTLLALSQGQPWIYRLNPASGSIIEQLPLSSPNHRSIVAYQGEILVADYGTKEFYLWGQTPGKPGAPGDPEASSSRQTPHSIRLTWTDPDQVPPWSRIRVYRDGSLLAAVSPGAQQYLDGNLPEHGFHSYFLTAFRQSDGTEGPPSDTVGTYAGCRPPITLRVPADYASIQAAIGAAADSNTVLVSPGVYAAGINFPGRNVCVLSLSGPDTTTIDARGLSLSAVRFDSTSGRGTVFSGFAIRNAVLYRDGLIHCGPTASPTIEDNVIAGNTIWSEGGGVVCEGGGSNVPTIRNNTIVFNTMLADTLGGFAGGGIRCDNCAAAIENNIVAFNDNSYGIYEQGPVFGSLSCNDVFADRLGPYFGCSAGAGDLAQDPLFCDSESSDLRLCGNSPCLNAGGCGRIGALGQGCGACASSIDHADHDVGNVIFTMTDQGILGFMDGTQSQGSGLVFPANGANLLYIGGLWVGVSPSYVANRDYDADPAKEWAVSSQPDGHIWIDYSGDSDQDIHAGYTDADAAHPLGLAADQESWAFADSLDDDSIIIRYFVENRGSRALTGLYAGLFLDLDITTPITDTGATDANSRLVYMTDGAGTYAGIYMLQGSRPPDGDGNTVPTANLTLIQNQTYVWPQGYVPDPDKYAFLTAADPAHVLTSANAPGDYSVLASAGPFDLASGGMREIAFAVVCGGSLDALKADAMRAQLRYLFPAAVPGPAGVGVTATRLLLCAPNPFLASTQIWFDLLQPARVRLDVHDVGGRLVRGLVNGPRGAGRQGATWNGRDDAGRRVPCGVYFTTLRADGVCQSRRIILLQ